MSHEHHSRDEKKHAQQTTLKSTSTDVSMSAFCIRGTGGKCIGITPPGSRAPSTPPNTSLDNQDAWKPDDAQPTCECGYCDEDTNSANEHCTQTTANTSEGPDATELPLHPLCRLHDVEKEMHRGMLWSATLEQEVLTRNLVICLENISERASRFSFLYGPSFAVYCIGISLAKALGRLGWMGLRFQFEGPFTERMNELWMHTWHMRR
jgi:hypothetical protein